MLNDEVKATEEEEEEERTREISSRLFAWTHSSVLDYRQRVNLRFIHAGIWRYFY